MNPEKQLEKLGAVIDLLEGDKATTEETAQIFALVFGILEKMQGQNEENMAQQGQTLDTTKEQLSKKIGESYDECKELYDSFSKKTGGDIESIREELSKQVKELTALIPKETDLSDLEAKIEQVRSEIPEKQEMPEKDTPIEVRDKLETLKEDDRLDKSAIKGIEEIEEKIKSIELRPAGRVGGGRGVNLYVDGVKKGLVNYLNLIAGSNVTLTYNRANGRNDITINSTGGGGGGSFSILTATGTVDDSNKVFTFASAPTLVVVNGTSYRDGHGVSISGTTATLDFPAGTGGDIYGIGN